MSLESAFSKAVKARDGWRCRIERWQDDHWVECGQHEDLTHRLFAAHIYARGWCGKAKLNPDVAITACLADHDRYDGRRRDGVIVRVSPEREHAAYEAISVAVTKFHVPRRLPPERPDHA